MPAYAGGRYNQLQVLLKSSEKYLRSAVSVSWIILIDEGAHFPACFQYLVDLVLQFAGAYPVNDNEVVLVMRNGQVQVFFECIQLQGQLFKIIQMAPGIREFFNVQVHLVFRRLQMLPALGCFINFIPLPSQGLEIRFIFLRRLVRINIK